MKRSMQTLENMDRFDMEEGAFLREITNCAVKMHADRQQKLQLSVQILRSLRQNLKYFHALCEQPSELLQHICAEKGLIEACLISAQHDAAPRLPSDGRTTRILFLMKKLVSNGGVRLDEGHICKTLAAFDAIQPLEMAELMSVPVALRIAVLDALDALLSEMRESVRSQRQAQAWVESGGRHTIDKNCDEIFLERALQLSIEMEKPELRTRLESCLLRRKARALWVVQHAQQRCAGQLLRLEHLMHARRLIEQIDWQDVFDALSAVENELNMDPDGTYPGMDDASRHAVRRELAALARRCGVSEIALARHAMQAARECKCTVCHFLMSDIGRGELAKRIGCARRLPRIVPDPSGKWSVGVVSGLTAAVFLLIYMLLDAPLLAIYILPLAWNIANEIIGRVFPKIIRPRPLLKMKLKSVPDHARTLVVLPVLLGSEARAREIVRHMEVLGCLERDQNIDFMLLGDFRDAETEWLDDDEAILNAAREGVAALNARAERPKYHYLHRNRSYREADVRWMGENRKRGALMALNRLLLGQEIKDDFSAQASGTDGLAGRYRYVVTLDADTEYLPGTLQQLIGAMMHPLNRDNFAVLQPGMQMTMRANVNDYVSMVAGHGGMDVYPCTISDFYQDMTAQGSFSGKGIYDVRKFQEALEGRLPDKEILSHDLIEGIIAGCASVSDVCFYDEHPERIEAEMNRLHRWTRGDWQLLRVLFGKMRIGLLGRFKLLGNLLRSLYAPALLGMLVHSCWIDARIAFSIALLSAYIVPLLHPFGQGLHPWKAATFKLACLPVQAFTQADAILRALWRLFVSGKKLMEWVPAADASGQSRNVYMPGRTAGILLLPGLLYPFWAPAVFALSALFIIGPVWAKELSANRQDEAALLTDAQRAFVKSLARKTWAFFEDHVSEDGAGLPPDNVQIDPPVGVAARTSPTNIGLYMMSCVAAHELGFISAEAMLRRMRATVDTLERLEKWHGQLYNWYDINDLHPLRPRYVSSVDSGNLAGALLLCAQVTAGMDPSLAGRIRRLAEGMDLAVFYREKSGLFAIGADVDGGGISQSHYDLYASESRILSYSAMMLGQVPVKHWKRLSRPLVHTAGGDALLSWSGTMFEYLMPELILKSHPDSLAGRTSRAVALQQMRFGMRSGRPWGVSESGYHQFDMQLNYQYRAFGLRSLALSGNAAQDVVAPYAAALALCCTPQEAIENLQNMCKMGWSDGHGLYEAADYMNRNGYGAPQLVKSHMAHHQGMALCAMCNLLCGDVLSERFMQIPQAQALHILLEEKPGRAARFHHRATQREVSCTPKRGHANYARNARAEDRIVDVQLLHGADVRVLANARGGLYAWSQDIQMNRCMGDLLNPSEGMYVHFENLESGESCVVGASGRIRFDAGMVRSEEVMGSISAALESYVSPESGVVYRRLTVENTSDKTLHAAAVSAFSVSLAKDADMRAHPAFQNLFVSVRRADARTLVHARRPRERHAEDPRRLVHTVCGEGKVEACTDMERLVGRTGAVSRSGGIARSFEECDGTVNPASALRLSFEMQPGEKRTIHFGTGICTEEDSAEFILRAQSAQEAERAQALAGLQARAALGYTGTNAHRHRLYQRAAAFLYDAHLHAAVNEEHAACGHADRRLLWQAGISGDLPIILVELPHDARMENVRTVVNMHAFYKLMGTASDLVLVDGHGNDYRQPVRDALSDLIASSHLNSLRGEKGGVFVIDGSGMPDELGAVLRRIAAMRFTANRDPMDQLRSTLEALALGPAAPERPMEYVRLPGRKLSYSNGFGGFDSDGSYRIELRQGRIPPAPWSNILANERFGAVLTDRGGGYAWAGNSRSDRLTPFLNDTLREGWGWMLRLSGEEGYMNLLPGDAPMTDFDVCFRPDACVYAGETTGLRFETDVYVREEGICFEVTLKNTSGHARTMTVSGFVDWLMGTDAQDAALMRCWQKHGACFASGASGRIGYFASNALDARPGRGRLAYLTDTKGSKGGGWSLEVPVHMKENETHSICFLLGAAEDIEGAYAAARDFRGSIPGMTSSQLRDIVQQIHVETPDKAVNLLANGFLQAQALHARILGRTGFYQPGGAYGFRDQLQDMLPLIYTDLQRVRRHLLYCAARQFPTGDVLHWWHDPYTGVRTHISDDLLFLPYVAARYVKATGDGSILQEQAPFLEELEIPQGREDIYAEMRPSGMTDTLHGHCMRAFRRAARYGRHGLCLMGSGDWNDGMNRVGAQGRGESIWLTEFLRACAGEYAEIAPNEDDKSYLHALQDALAASIEQVGWDGGWYLRAYTDDGEKLGSAESKECKIDLISQAWAVLSGLDSQRCRAAMDAAWEALADTRAGILRLLTPPFSGEELDPGYIAAYPRGVRENGAQYTHAACWLMLALVRMGDAERAHQALNCLLPVKHADTQEKALVYRVEPYVMAADIYTHPALYGRGGWTWYTGSGAWMLMCIYELLGFERRGNRVRLNALLGSWPQAALTLRCGTAEYKLVSTGDVSHVFLDGIPVEDGFIEMKDDGKKHVAMFPGRKQEVRHTGKTCLEMPDIVKI